MLIRKIVIGILVLAKITIGQLYAQSHPNSTKKNTHDTLSIKDEKTTITFLLPDFLQYDSIKIGDTTFVYEYYDKNSHQINIYDLNNIDEIDHIKYYKMFHGFSTPVNSIVSHPFEYIQICEFAHPDPDLWVRFNHHSGEKTKYSIHKNEIVKIDSVIITNPKTNDQRKLIYKYYKTEIISKEKTREH